MILVKVLEDANACFGVNLTSCAHRFLWIVRTVNPAKACKNHTEASQDDEPGLCSAIWW